MQAVISVKHCKHSHPGCTRETEKMHGGVIHTKKNWKIVRLIRFKVMRMLWHTMSVCPCKQVKITARILHIGIDADETAEMHDEYKVEISHSMHI